ncbi:MAG: lactate utilization protein [Clostridiales bacterium]|nr:lactate utilization protein [Clostridiales bacterium]
MEQLEQNALEAMRKNGFEVVCLKDAQAVKEYLLEQIGQECSVGCGGSMSVQETGVLTALAQKGCKVYCHSNVPPEERPQTMRNARTADVYLTSANAVTKTGKLVLVDGTGNRVGAVCDGPARLYFVIGRQKLVDGGINTAVSRIKKVACPKNAARLGLGTSCARTGLCSADCPESMCRLTVAVDRTPRGRSLTVLWVEQPLGY